MFIALDANKQTNKNTCLILCFSGALDVRVGTPSNFWSLDVGQAYSLLWGWSSLRLTSDDYSVPREHLHKEHESRQKL